jgi:hypothetical protein
LLGRCGPRGRFRRRDRAAVDALLPTIAMFGPIGLLAFFATRRWLERAQR